MSIEALSKARDAAKAALQKHAASARITELNELIAKGQAKGTDVSKLVTQRDQLKITREKDCGVGAAVAALNQARTAEAAKRQAKRAAAYAKMGIAELEAHRMELSAKGRELQEEIRAVNLALSQLNSETKVAKILSELSPADRAALLEELSE